MRASKSRYGAKEDSKLQAKHRTIFSGFCFRSIESANSSVSSNDSGAYLGRRKFVQIEKHKHVTLAYSLKNDQGTLLDSTKDQNPFAYVHGTSAIMPALEQALMGKSPGDEVTVRIPSERAYGERNESLVFSISKAKFNDTDTIAPGTRVRVRTPSGEQILEITEVDGERVTLDGNHPLAGVNLNFEVSVVRVRDCTKEELDRATASAEKES